MSYNARRRKVTDSSRLLDTRLKTAHSRSAQRGGALKRDAWRMNNFSLFIILFAVTDYIKNDCARMVGASRSDQPVPQP